MILKQLIPILLIALFSYINSAYSLSDEEKIILLIEKSNKMKLSKSKEWKSLLHYIGSQSTITDDKFFISSKGKNNPELELQETIKSFFIKNKNLNESYICK